MIMCIYHSNCADGFGAAFAFRLWAIMHDRIKETEFHAGVYQADPPDVTGRDVVLLDFSYKRSMLEDMARRARSVLVLDHHRSAADDLAGLPLPVSMGPVGPAPADWGYVDVASGYDTCALESCARDSNGLPLYALFDMERSGAGMAWDFFHPDGPRPALINHIEDRDLWRFALDGTREIMAALFSYPYDFKVWGDLMGASVNELRADGVAIERKHHKDIAELVAVCKRRMTIGGQNVPVASLPYTLSSDAGHLMAQGEPFAACYWDTPQGRTFSLRSSDDGVDVSAIATQYGGGGHRNAAGFSVGFAEALAFEVSTP